MYIDPSIADAVLESGHNNDADPLNIENPTATTPPLTHWDASRLAANTWVDSIAESLVNLSTPNSAGTVLPDSFRSHAIYAYNERVLGLELHMLSLLETLKQILITLSAKELMRAADVIIQTADMKAEIELSKHIGAHYLEQFRNAGQ